jgi:uncharacterized protein YwgA
MVLSDFPTFSPFLEYSMPQKINNRKDLLLLLFYSPGATEQINEPISGRTRLMKMLFLFKQEGWEHFKKGTDITEDNFYQFFEWDFGPFSKDVYDDLTFFILREFIEVRNLDQESLPESVGEWKEWLMVSGVDFDREEFGIDEYFEEEFCLKKKGIEFTESMYNSLSKSQTEFLKSFKAKFNNTPLRAILRYVYTKYPEMTKNSKIMDQVIPNG